MAPLRTAALFLGAITATSAFAPAGKTFTKVTTTTPSTVLNADLSAFEEGAEIWKKEFPQFAKWGWGPTPLAEKWNGRHAMFGWVVLCATAYAKGHGIIPDADLPLDLKEWGTLSIIMGKTTITNERAIILIANIHAFMVGLMAAIAPAPWADPLLLDPDFKTSDEGAAWNYVKAEWRNKNPFGIIPAFKPGLTEEAEAFNGRLAMLGLCVLAGASAMTGESLLDVINDWLGGAYY